MGEPAVAPLRGRAESARRPVDFGPPAVGEVDGALGVMAKHRASEKTPVLCL